MTMPDGAILALYHVDTGEAGYLVDDTPLPWSRGQGVVSRPDEAVVMSGTDPADLIELAAIPRPRTSSGHVAPPRLHHWPVPQETVLVGS
jgi:hypothetical protein